MSSNIKRIIIIGAAGLGLIFYIIMAMNTGKKNNNPGIQVDVSIVKKTDLVTVVSGRGKIEAEDKAYLRAEINGLIKKIYVKAGQKVNKGDLLIQFDDRQFIYNYQKAYADLQTQEQAQLYLENTRQKYERTKQLFLNGAISREQFDNATLDLDKEEKQVFQSIKLSRINLANAKQDLERTKVRATRNGMILYCPVKEGMTVTPGTELSQIGDPKLLVAELPVDEIDIPSIELGQEAAITQEGLPDLKIWGKIIEIAPQAVSEAGENIFPVKIRIDNSKGLLFPGMSVNTEIITHNLENILTIPLVAILEEEKNGYITKYVFKVKENLAIKTRIVTGFSNDSDSEVRSGLKEGDSYILGDYETILHLKDRSKIQPRKNFKRSENQQ